MQRTICLVGVSVLLALGACGCREKTKGGSLWPQLDRPKTIVFSGDDLAIIHRVKNEHPDLIGRIKEHTDALAAIIDAYNERAIQHNRKILKQYLTDEEVDRLIPTKPQTPEKPD